MAARVTCACGWTRTYNSRARAEANAARHVCKTTRRDGVRRTTRHYRCARCGYEATYHDAGAKEARGYFDRHSCRKHEEAMLRAAIHEERLAAIDRTPKPCFHKQANHQHGERATYVLDKCRCEPCSKANAEAENWRERQKAYGRYHKYVAAEHVRAHLTELKEYGIGLKQVSALSGVSNGSLTKIWYGLYGPAEGPHKGCKGNGELLRGPSRRVLRSTAERIFAVEPVPANLSPRQPDHERTPLARSQIRSLVAIGWSMSRLGERLGIAHRGNFNRTVTSDTPMTRATVDRIEALFEELCMTLPPETTRQERQVAARSRRYAQVHGWKPPLALEDAGEQQPEDVGDLIDHAAVERRLDGDRTVRLTKPERVEVVHRALSRGMSHLQITRQLGISKPERYVTRNTNPTGETA